jgi:DNA-binding GntR family transcriptional regulator
VEKHGLVESEPANRSRPRVITPAAFAGNTGTLERVLARSLDPTSLVFRIARDVGAQIIVGSLSPGTRISSVDLAQRYDASRAPVRQALLVLEREGLITTASAGRAPSVRRLTLEELREIYEIRANLYGLVAQRCVRHASDAQIAGLRSINERLVALAAADDLDGYFWTNLEFRDEEARVAGSQRLRQLLDALGLHTLVTRYAGLSLPKHLPASVHDHESLLRAYEARNETLAVAVGRSIVLSSLAGMEQFNWAGIRAGGEEASAS